MPVSTDTSIRSHTLANGLTLVGEPDTSFSSAAFNLLVPAGCVADPVGRPGLASLTCELMLRGAGDRDNHAIINDLEHEGVDRSESVSVSQAVFAGSGVAESLEPALRIYADVVRRPHLAPEQLEPSRAVCLQELQGIEDEPAHKLMQELRRQHYPAPWGRPSQGRAESLAQATIDEAREFHRRAYGPEGAILAVAGSFDWQRLCDLAEELFGDWPAPHPTPAEQPEQVAPVEHIPAETDQSHIGIAFDSLPYRHPDYFQAWAAVGVLSGGMSSRLFTEVREKRGLCYTVSASLQSQRDRAAVFCYAGTSAERAQETLDVTYAELVKLAAGVRPEELARLKARIKSGLIMQQESTSSRSGALARDWRHLGRARPVEELSALIDAVTADSINAYLAEHPPAGFTLVTLGREPLASPLT
ncbi:MAG: pitrilysin family protein [Planctomycetota bacterium]